MADNVASAGVSFTARMGAFSGRMSKARAHEGSPSNCDETDLVDGGDCLDWHVHVDFLSEPLHRSDRSALTFGPMYIGQ